MKNKIPIKRRALLQLHKLYTPAAWLVSGRLLKRLWTKFYFGSFPRPFDEFCAARFGGSAIGAEVGVFRGNHAASLCKHVRPMLLYAVDGYRAYNEWEDLKPLMESAQKEAKRRLKKYRVQFVPCDSLEAHFADLDFVYIDAAHDYESVVKDIDHWWKAVRSGGVLGGHDFDHANDDVIVVRYGVVQAVIEFVTKNKLQLYVKGADWWVVKP